MDRDAIRKRGGGSKSAEAWPITPVACHQLTENSKTQKHILAQMILPRMIGIGGNSTNVGVHTTQNALVHVSLQKPV